mgnify:CR=1 FL=1|jgi:hypothetical protein
MAEVNSHSNSEDEVTVIVFLLSGVLLALGGVVVYLSWPISPLLLLSMGAWWFTSAWSANPWGEALAGFFGPVTAGLAFLSLLLLLVNLLLFIFALDSAKYTVPGLPRRLYQVQSGSLRRLSNPRTELKPRPIDEKPYEPC